MNSPDPDTEPALSDSDVALRGTASFVAGAVAAAHFLVLADGLGGAAMLARGATGLTMRAAPGPALQPFFDLTFEDASTLWLDISAAVLADIALAARLA